MQQHSDNWRDNAASPELIALITLSALNPIAPATLSIPLLTSQIALFKVLKSQFKLEANWPIAAWFPLMEYFF